MNRAPHPTETCTSCADYLRQLGDRDKEVREWMARARKVERADEELQLVRDALDRADAPTHADNGHRLSVAGRVNGLAQMARGWMREDA